VGNIFLDPLTLCNQFILGHQSMKGHIGTCNLFTKGIHYMLRKQNKISTGVITIKVWRPILVFNFSFPQKFKSWGTRDLEPAFLFIGEISPKRNFQKLKTWKSSDFGVFQSPNLNEKK